MLRKTTKLRASFSHPSPSGPTLPQRTGHPQVDSALERHSIVDQTARDAAKAAQEYCALIRKHCDASAVLTRSLSSFYSGTPGQERCRVFAKAHERVDKEVPDKLLDLAHKHVLTRLEVYLKTLDELAAEIKEFQEKQSLFIHYEKKVEKLHEEKRKRDQEQKGEKTKQIEKMVRNEKKLDDARHERDAMVESLINRLDYIYNTRSETMDPIFKAIFQFQQEFYKQCTKSLDIELPAATEGYVNKTTTSSVLPETPAVAQGNVPRFDDHGNRIIPPIPARGSAPPPQGVSRPPVPAPNYPTTSPPKPAAPAPSGRPPAPPPPGAYVATSDPYPSPSNSNEEEAFNPNWNTTQSNRDDLVDKWFG